MKLKEVCLETGLSRKTIRLYEEKGLLIPQMERRNGRDYREYTPEDIRKLKTIAMLRRAWFTMDEIKQMMDDPNTIQEIFPQYVEWLQNQKQELEGLLSVAKTVNPRYVSNIEQLSGFMSAAAAKMPLPKYDVKPKFKYLDELEARPNLRPPTDPLDLVMSGEKEKTQAAVAISRDKRDDLLVKVSMMNETYAVLKDTDSGPVPDKEVTQEPKWLRFITGLLTLLFLVSFALFLNDAFHFFIYPKHFIFFLITAILRGGLALRKHARERDAWLERIGQPVRKYNIEKKHILMGVIGLILVIGIAIAIPFGLEAIKSNLTPDIRIGLMFYEDVPRETLDEYENNTLKYLLGDMNHDGANKALVENVSYEELSESNYDMIFIDQETLKACSLENTFITLPEKLAYQDYPDLMPIRRISYFYNLFKDRAEGNIYLGIPVDTPSETASLVIALLDEMYDRYN